MFLKLLKMIPWHSMKAFFYFLCFYFALTRNISSCQAFAKTISINNPASEKNTPFVIQSSRSKPNNDFYNEAVEHQKHNSRNKRGVPAEKTKYQPTSSVVSSF